MSKPYRGSGTERMAQRLEHIAASIDPNRNPTANSARLDAMDASQPPADLRTLTLFSAAYAQELLHAGRSEEAFTRFDQLLSVVEQYSGQFPARFVREMRDLRAVSYLRLGLLDNCTGPHATERCSVPTGEGGVYEAETGPRRALGEYRRILEAEPDNLGARWLFNLASMALGKYPDGVPEGWLIPPHAFESEYDIKRFRDVAPEHGLHVVGHAGGSIIDDFDRDGYLDIMTSSRGPRDQLRYFRNSGNGTFTDRTIAAGLEGIVSGLNLIQADYDNDGYLDVLVLRGAWLPDGLPNSLLRNNGDGTFEDVTEEAGLLQLYATQTATWTDYNNDGWIDLFIGNETWTTAGAMMSSPSGSAIRTEMGNPAQLLRNNGDGTFTDVARVAGVAVVGLSKGVLSGDFDNDGRPDLFISRADGPNVLLRNNGPDDSGQWTFTDVSDPAGITEPIESFSAWFWDFDNDGWVDIFVAGYRAKHGDVAAEYLGLPHQAELPRLYRNNGDGTFSDVTVNVRLNRILHQMGGNFGDLDNDGYLDIYSATGNADLQTLIPNRVFRNEGGRFFQDVTTAGGFGHIQKGHGVAFGDIDNDGDQDLYVNMGGAFEGDVGQNVLFENPGHGNEWITLRLEGVQSNRAAIGARIKVTVETTDGPRTIYRTVSSGGSFGASSLQQEIGLGAATAIRELTVSWPASGRTDTYRDVALNTTYAMREGDAAPRPVTLKRLSLSTGR